MTLDLMLRSMLRDVVREVVREEMAPAAARAPESDFLTYAKAAALVGVSAKTVKQWAYSGRLATYGEGRLKRVKPDEVRACMTKEKRAPVASVEIDNVVAKMLAKGKR